MSDKEYLELTRKLDYGLQLAERRMLEEKALHNQDVIVCDAYNNIQRIPARQVLASF
jgi:hypothetical protein